MIFLSIPMPIESIILLTIVEGLCFLTAETLCSPLSFPIILGISRSFLCSLTSRVERACLFDLEDSPKIPEYHISPIRITSQLSAISHRDPCLTSQTAVTSSARQRFRVGVDMIFFAILIPVESIRSITKWYPEALTGAIGVSPFFSSSD
jgi:hypothetical protein